MQPKPLLALLLVPLMGCVAAPSGRPADSPSTGASGPVSVRAVKRTITPVLVVNSSVIAGPQFQLLTENQGVLDIKVKVGDTLSAGTEVAKLDGVVIKTPAPGTVTWRANVGPSSLPKNFPFVTITYPGFGGATQIPAADAYRVAGLPVGALAGLTGGASGFSCVLVPGVAAGGEQHEASSQGTAATMAPSDATGGGGNPAGSADAATGPRYVCLIPNSTVAYAGQNMKIGLRFRDATDVLTLPLTAVAGSAQAGSVRMCDAQGNPGSVRSITLGVTDGDQVEVKSGLSQDDLVCSTPPQLGEK